jgi:hypothetical protein
MRAATAGFLITSCLVCSLQAQTTAPAGPTPQRVDVTPATAEAEVGQTLPFSAMAIGQDGSRVDAKPSRWLTAPFDSAAANEDGTVTFFLPGVIKVGAVINGKTGFASVTVKPQAAARIEIDAPRSALTIGASIALSARAFVTSGDPLATQVGSSRPSRRASPRFVRQRAR